MSLVSSEIQAQWFSKVREAHQKEMTEDYVELIADLIEYKELARVSDLAQRFGVSKATASKIVSRLKEEGFIKRSHYKSLELSAKGEKLAVKCKERHQIVLDFLIKLGVPTKIAQFDSEGIEHHISKETLAVMRSYFS